MEKNAKIYIAGHGGLAGSAFMRRLHAEGYTRLITRTRADLDLTNQAAVAAFFRSEKPDYVILAAAKVGGIYANSTYPADFIYSNLAIQTNILHQSYVNDVRRLLFLGSSCIYPRDTAQPIKESQLLTGPLEPTNAPYAVAKISGIQMCWAYNRQYGTRFIPVMPTNLYGPGDRFDLLNAHVLPALLRKCHLARLSSQGHVAEIARDQKVFGPIPGDIKDKLTPNPSAGADPTVELWGTGKPKREFLFCDDLADGCLRVMDTPFDTLCTHVDDPNRMLINVGTGRDCSIEALSAIAADVVGYCGPILWNHDMPDGTPRKCLDVTVLNSMGWHAGTDLRDGIRKTYQWYLSHPANQC
jgi:GDP-L-fucose synthase